MTIAVALSGGVDSSVAAALLKQQGYNLVGLTMLVPGQDPAEARRVADSLSIPYHLLDLRSTFEREVVDYFCAEYGRGRTPNPCIRCNERVKFGVLLREAGKLGAERLATGHYARVTQDKDGLRQLRRGADEAKDQSYFLYRLGQEQLARVLMPVGGHTKEQVRELARRFDLPVAEGRESQEICFVPDDDYAGFLRERKPELFRPGPVLDTNGKEIGRHDGIAGFTVGQRKGLGIAFGERRYVVRIEPEADAVILGEEKDVCSRVAELEHVHWISGWAPESAFRAVVRIRSQHPGQAAVVKPLPGGRAELVFDEAQRALTPGQAAVCYQGDVVLGGGTTAGPGG